MTLKKITVATLCALFSHQAAQAKYHELAAQPPADVLVASAAEESAQTKQTDTLGVWKTATHRPVFKIAKSDLLLAHPKDIAPVWDTQPTEQRGKRTFLRYKILTPQNRLVDVSVARVVPADTATNMPELWILRAKNLTKEEFKAGVANAYLETGHPEVPGTINPQANVKSILDPKALAFWTNSSKIFDAASKTMQEHPAFNHLRNNATNNFHYPAQFEYRKDKKSHIGYVSKNPSSYFTPLLAHSALAFQFTRDTQYLIDLLKNTDNKDDKKAIANELRKMADRFFSKYNLTDDQTLLSNALLLTESQQNNPLASYAPYQALRGTGKPTYPMAKTILNNNAFSTNALEFNTYLNELESGTPRNTSKEEQDPNQLIHYFANLHAAQDIFTRPAHHADDPAKKPNTRLQFQLANPKSTTSTSIPLADWLSPHSKALATDENNLKQSELDQAKKAAETQAAAEKAAAERAASTTRTPTTRKPATMSPTPRTPNPRNPPRNPNGGGG
jgi:hypothetical protein